MALLIIGVENRYGESSFTLTQTSGATVNLAFNGTAVSLLGAMRGNHGLYTVTVDGTQSASMNGSASSTDKLQPNVI